MFPGKKYHRVLKISLKLNAAFQPITDEARYPDVEMTATAAVAVMAGGAATGSDTAGGTATVAVAHGEEDAAGRAAAVVGGLRQVVEAEGEHRT